MGPGQECARTIPYAASWRCSRREHSSPHKLPPTTILAVHGHDPHLRLGNDAPLGVFVGVLVGSVTLTSLEGARLFTGTS